MRSWCQERNPLKHHRQAGRPFGKVQERINRGNHGWALKSEQSSEEQSP